MVAVELADAIEGSPPMQWVVSCELAFEVLEPAEVVVQVVAARSVGEVLEERFRVATDGEAVRSVEEVSGADGARLQVIQAERGRLSIDYRAAICAPLTGPTRSTELMPSTGRDGRETLAAVLPGSSGPPAVSSAADPSRRFLRYDRQVFLRPSRYCPSDHLIGFAVAEFGTGPDTGARVAAITEWIRERIGYVPGSSSVHDSAEDTLLTAVGTCRDFAHLGIALSRATGVPARFAAVYAPGLSPMDFHAVFETLEDGRWYVHDATALAPRQSLVRMVTGRDAADAAFAAITSGIANLELVDVSATVAPELPVDDHVGAVELA